MFSCLTLINYTYSSSGTRIHHLTAWATPRDVLQHTNVYRVIMCTTLYVHLIVGTQQTYKLISNRNSYTQTHTASRHYILNPSLICSASRQLIICTNGISLIEYFVYFIYYFYLPYNIIIYYSSQCMYFNNNNIRMKSKFAIVSWK